MSICGSGNFVFLSYLSHLIKNSLPLSSLFGAFDLASSPRVFQSKTRQLLNCSHNNLLVHETSPSPPLNHPRNQPNIFVLVFNKSKSYHPMKAMLFLELITFNTKIEQISSKIIMKWKISSDYSVKNNHHY